MDREMYLLKILHVGRDTSMRGAGISLLEAISRSRYEEFSPSFSPSDLLPLVQENSTLAQEWAAYSEDKRTSGGWYLTGRQIGQVTTDQKLEFASTEEAVANYVVHELDFWVSVRGNG